MRRLHNNAEFITWRDRDLAPAVRARQDRGRELAIAVLLVLLLPWLLGKVKLPFNKQIERVLEVITVSERYTAWVHACVSLQRCIDEGQWVYGADPAAIAAVVIALNDQAFDDVLRWYGLVFK